MEDRLKTRAYKIALDWIVQHTDRTYFREFVELFRVVRAALIAEREGREAGPSFVNRIGYTGVTPWTGVKDGIKRLEIMAKVMTTVAGGYDIVLVDVHNKAVVPLLEAPQDTSGMVPVSVDQVLLGRIRERKNLN